MRQGRCPSHSASPWSRAPKQERFLITGDTHQLPAYTHLLRGEVLEGGLESIIQAVQRRKTIPSSSLSHSYRAYPALTKLQAVFYPEGFTSGLLPEESQLIPSMSFPFPNPQVPMAIIDTPGPHQTSTSGFNLEQEEMAADLVKAILARAPTASVVLYCYYAVTKANLETNVRVKTVDGFQGRETDVTIIITTRTATHTGTRSS
ncbi:hypothetical protein QR680_006525 [Steinernema hermaphroditum]|uniref:DNA2/NAM7 helicase-like C-terminal domain-containing protein n=1 Tax=Steinernema hermaphroditum TaxID=289476 RepID=A0AA39HY49_9BILA|nr:hypothetical protein QR680_006525 [Steinernema hermaphroditum]